MCESGESALLCSTDNDDRVYWKFTSPTGSVTRPGTGGEILFLCTPGVLYKVKYSETIGGPSSATVSVTCNPGPWQ